MAGFIETKGKLPKGAYFSGKQMLVLSLDDLDGDPVLRIEIEPHYSFPEFLVIKHFEIPETKIEDILNDYDFCKTIGFWIFLETPAGRYDRPAVILSIKDFKNYKKLRLDVKNYFYDEKRKFIKNIPLPSWDENIIFKNDRLLQAVGKIVLETLLSLEEQWPPPEK